MDIEFPDDVKKRLEQKLRGFCLEEFGEELGELRLRRVYEFMTECVAVTAYNQGIADAAAWMQGKVLDLEADLRQPH